MKTMVKVAVTAAMLVAGSTALAQSDYDNRWYVSAFGGFAELDSDRAGVDNDAYFGIGFGRFFSEDFSVELELDRVESDFNSPVAVFDNEFNAKSLGVYGRFHMLSPDSMVRPFVGLGIGGTYRDAFDTDSLPGDKDTAIFLAPVAGLKFTFSDNFGGRLQAAWRNDLGNDSALGQTRYNDFLFSAGLTYSFGSRSTPPPPPPPAEPPPPPAPGPCDLDDDNDGVPNCRDKCPNTAAGTAVDQDGCEVQVIIDLPNVNFAFDKAELTPTSFAILDDAVATLSRHQNVMIEVAGHTDWIGSERYNLDLSDRRSAVVRDYLISKGVSADRMSSAGYGEARPIATNETDAGRAQNRRTELVVTGR